MSTINAPIFAALLAAVLTHGAGAHQHSPAPAAPTTAAAAAAAPLAARFEFQSDGRKTSWYLWRSADRIETANTASGQGEIWERQGRDGYSYRRIFHPDRRVVEYTPGELKTREVAPDWAQLGSVIPPRLLERLKRVGSKPMFGQRASHYTGRLDGDRIDLWWLEDARLPARLQRAGHHGATVLTLRELKADAPTAWPRAEEAKIAGYGLIDAADFGDMESDPFVAKVLRQDGHAHHH